MSERITCQNTKNQALIDALVDLAHAMANQHSNDDSKSAFKANAIRRAARSLAALSEPITRGKPLSEPGPHKVKGVGAGTAYYIDEFLQTGTIAEIEQLKMKTRERASAKPVVTPDRTKSERDDKKILINRAPVLTLWVVAVSEKLGYNIREAHTYGRWIAGIFAQAKGRKLGIFEEESENSPPAKKQRTEHERVEIFHNVKVPVEVQPNGDRLARMDDGGETIDPKQVEYYLQGAFGDRLVDVKEAMEMLANSMSSDEELRKRAYSLYEQFRPEWKGWGKKGTLHLDKIRELAKQQQ